MQSQTIGHTREVGQWALVLHLSQLAGYVFPLVGWVAPIIIWQIKKEGMPGLDAHGRVVANWLISVLIYGFVCGLLTLVLIGLPLLIILAFLCLIFPIVGGIKATDGVVWKYPGSISFF